MCTKTDNCFLAPDGVNIDGMKDILDIDKIIAKNLKRLRTGVGWTQAELAEKLNSVKSEDGDAELKEVNAVQICKIETNEKGLGKKLMMKMCEVFGIQPYEFYLTEDAIIAQDDERYDLDVLRQSKKLNIHDEIRRLMRYRLQDAIATVGDQTRSLPQGTLVTDTEELEMLNLFREAMKYGLGTEVLRLIASPL